MAKDPGDRYQSAGDMRNDIQRALSGMPVAAPTRAAGYQGTRRMGAATAVAGPTGAIPAYEYGADDQPPQGGRRRRWPWIVAAVVALALVGGLIFAFQYISGNGGNIAVPPVNGETQRAAVQAITAAHLKPDLIPRASSSVAKGHVINTTPGNGQFVQKNSVVKVFVSTGPTKVTVPDVRGQQVAAAANILTGKNLQVNEVSVSSTQTANQVVKESPAQGTLVAPGTTVTLYYSRGGVSVPSVIGDPASDGPAGPGGGRVQGRDAHDSRAGLGHSRRRVQPESERRERAVRFRRDHLRRRGAVTEPEPEPEHQHQHPEPVSVDKLAEPIKPTVHPLTRPGE